MKGTPADDGSEDTLIDRDTLQAELDITFKIEEANLIFADALEHIFKAELTGDFSTIDKEKQKLEEVKVLIDEVIEVTRLFNDKAVLGKLLSEVEQIIVELDVLTQAEANVIALNENIEHSGEELIQDSTLIINNAILDSKSGIGIINAEIDSVEFSLIVGIVIATLLMILINMIIASAITKPLSEVVKVNQSLQQLNFAIDTKKVDKLTRRKDEIGVLATSSKKMIDVIREILMELDNSVHSLTDSAEVSMSESENLSSLATQESSSVGELSDTIEELAKSISEVAHDISHLAHTTHKTNENGSVMIEKSEVTLEAVEGGRTQLEHISETMNIIVESMNQLKSSILNLTTSADEIKSIIGMIEGIASQTNLLALNAAIEAARAGEAGKGFAVVSDEIRKLAEDSTSSTAQISELISNMETTIFRTSDLSEEAMTHVNESTEVVDKAHDSFDKIIEAVHVNNDLTAEIIEYMNDIDDSSQNIASVTQEQAASAEEISATIATISDMAEEVNQSGEEMAKTAMDVQSVTEQVQNISDKFTM